MAERYMITKDAAVDGVAPPEQLKLKIDRNAALSKEKTAAAAKKKADRKAQRTALKERTLKYDKEYSDFQKKLVSMRREAKATGNFFMEPDAKLLFVIRIVGIIKL